MSTVIAREEIASTICTSTYSVIRSHSTQTNTIHDYTLKIIYDTVTIEIIYIQTHFVIENEQLNKLKTNTNCTLWLVYTVEG